MACSRVTFTFIFTLVCVNRDLIWVTRKLGVKNRKPYRTVQYTGSAACVRDVTCYLLTIRQECHSSEQYEALWKMPFEPHFQMDIDVFQRDFAEKGGYVTGHKLTIEYVLRTQKTSLVCSWQRASCY